MNLSAAIRKSVQSANPQCTVFVYLRDSNQVIYIDRNQLHRDSFDRWMHMTQQYLWHSIFVSSKSWFWDLQMKQVLASSLKFVFHADGYYDSLDLALFANCAECQYWHSVHIGEYWNPKSHTWITSIFFCSRIVYESYHCIQGDKVNQGKEAVKDENN